MRLGSIFFVLFLTICTISCKDENVKAPDPTAITDSLPVTFQKNLYKKAQLQERAESQVELLEGYKELKTALNAINGMTIAEAKTHAEQWVNATLELQIALLDSVKNRAINSRMTLLRTKANLFKQEIEKRKVDTAIINTEATEFYNAFQDLSVQLNREYGSSVDEFLKEFEQESQKLRREARERQNQNSNNQ